MRGGWGAPAQRPLTRQCVLHRAHGVSSWPCALRTGPAISPSRPRAPCAGLRGPPAAASASGPKATAPHGPLVGTGAGRCHIRERQRFWGTGIRQEQRRGKHYHLVIPLRGGGGGGCVARLYRKHVPGALALCARSRNTPPTLRP